MFKYIKDNWQDEYRKLEKNWDSYNAYPIGEQAIQSVQQILDHLDDVQLVPTVNGGIALVWFVRVPQYEESAEVSLRIASNGEEDYDD